MSRRRPTDIAYYLCFHPATVTREQIVPVAGADGQSGITVAEIRGLLAMAPHQPAPSPTHSPPRNGDDTTNPRPTDPKPMTGSQSR